MKSWKSFFAGALTMLLIVGVMGTASATVGKVTQELEYRDIKVSLDGKLLDLRNAAGEKVEPFMFGGTNYLPVRALAESLGLNVAWDGANATVVLTHPSTQTSAASAPQQTQGTAPAASKEPYTITDTYYKTRTNVLGNRQFRAIVEITNTGSKPLYLKSATFDLEDTSGHLLQSENFISCCPDIIKPGEKGYFYNGASGTTIHDDIPDLAGVKFVPHVNVVDATGTAVDYTISDTSLTKGTFDAPTLSGRVTNTSGKDDPLYYIEVVYYDKAGKILSITGTNLTDFKAGETRSFSISGIGLWDDVTMDSIASYNVISRAGYYQF